jgi:hypothetical protein
MQTVTDSSAQRTPEAQKAAAADRAFYLALLQATETCKNNLVSVAAGNTSRPRRQDCVKSPHLAERRIRHVFWGSSGEGQNKKCAAGSGRAMLVNGR